MLAADPRINQDNESSNDLTVKRNLINYQESNEIPLSTKAVQMVPDVNVTRSGSYKNNAKGHPEVSKNGYIMPSEKELQGLETQHEYERHQRTVPHNTTVSNESALNKLTRDHDSAKHSHCSKKDRKIKKHHKLKDGTGICESNLDPNQLYVNHNVANEVTKVIDSDGKLRIEKGTPLVPKLIIARTKFQKGSKEYNDFAVKENLTDEDPGGEKNLKRRRSSPEDFMLNESEGKRKKNEQKLSKVTNVPSIPKGSKRFSIPVEDGE